MDFKEYKKGRIKLVVQSIFNNIDKDKTDKLVVDLLKMERILPKNTIKPRTKTYLQAIKYFPDIETKGKTTVLTDLQKKYIKYGERITEKGKEFTIPFDLFYTLLDQSCYYCGSNDKMTIDRIDSNIGYTANNCVPCCSHCNTMKWDKPQNEFLEQIKRIYEHNFK